MKTVFNYNTPVAAEWFNVVNGFRLRFDGDPLLPGDMVDGQYLPIRTEDLDPSVLADYAQVLYTVSTTDNQNINGNKTFLDPVTIVPGVNSNHAISVAQLNAAVATLNTAITDANTARLALEAATVKLTTAQIIDGVKTFISSPLVPPGSVPGAAVNKAQLDALPYLDSGVNYLRIGSTLLKTGVNEYTAGQQQSTIAFNTTFADIPNVNFTQYGGDQTANFVIINVTLTNFTIQFRTGNPGAGSISWSAIGRVS